MTKKQIKRLQRKLANKEYMAGAIKKVADCLADTLTGTGPTFNSPEKLQRQVARAGCGLFIPSAKGCMTGHFVRVCHLRGLEVTQMNIDLGVIRESLLAINNAQVKEIPARVSMALERLNNLATLLSVKTDFILVPDDAA